MSHACRMFHLLSIHFNTCMFTLRYNALSLQYSAVHKILTESRMLPNTRLAPMPAKPAALPKALEGTRRSLSFFFTSSFCSLICKDQQRSKQTVILYCTFDHHMLCKST